MEEQCLESILAEQRNQSQFALGGFSTQRMGAETKSYGPEFPADTWAPAGTGGQVMLVW